MVGPAVTIVMFKYDGYGDWTLKELRLVIYVGMVLNVAIAVLLCFFDDSKALGEEADSNLAADDPLAVAGPAGSTAAGSTEVGSTTVEADVEKLGVAGEAGPCGEDKGDRMANVLLGCDVDAKHLLDLDELDEAAAAIIAERRRRRTELIPIITFCSGLVSSLGYTVTSATPRFHSFPRFIFFSSRNLSRGVVSITS
jgi:hypothetical protein